MAITPTTAPVPTTPDDGPSPLVRLDAGPADIVEPKRLLRRGARVGNEQFGEDSHSTSVHVHPRKLTYLLCRGGEA